MDNTNKRIILNSQQTGIKELTLFAYATENKAQLPTLSHSHKDKIEIVILLKGMQQFSVNANTFTLYENEAFIVHSDESHFCGESFNPENEMLWFQIDLAQAKKEVDPYSFEIIENFFKLSRCDADELLSKIISLTARKFVLGKKLAFQFKESFSLICSREIDKKIAGRSLFLYCFLSLLSKKAEITLLSPEIDKAKRYILHHLNETIDIDELNIKSGDGKMSHSKFKQKFKDEIGFYPRDYIKGMKIESAKKLLSTTNKTIEEIAFEYSFASKYFFVCAFKEIVGITPKKYRQKSKKFKRNLRT
ncbi:MAG: AraC family transcriptional regulator [Oscillospiraceae bacterium]